jgi:hypothetical protein
VIVALVDRRPIEDNKGRNDRFVRKVLALIDHISKVRGEASSYGELTVKFAWESGIIKSVKVMEETILKPED